MRVFFSSVTLAVALTACGGRSSENPAPSNLGYATNPATYTLGTPITANVPSNSGGAVVSYSVVPPLPAGLALDADSGVISGTPNISGSASYTLTASNAMGTTTATLRLTVNPIWSDGGHTATLLPNGKVLITGGLRTMSEDATLSELYDPVTRKFTGTGRLLTGRQYHTATLLPNGKVLIVGGVGFPNEFATIATAELYDAATGTFTAAGTTVVPRTWGHSATLLRNGQVLIAGGDASTFATGALGATAELYDPVAGTFTATGNLLVACGYCTATLLADGRVLLAGGMGNGPVGILASAELYDPAAATFTETGSLATARYWHTATLLPTGQVLIAGGEQSDSAFLSGALSSAELYDPVAGTFTATGNMVTARYRPTATLLSSGDLLMTGGSSEASSAELYDPLAGTFAATGNLLQGRSGQSATLLTTGEVLIVGGDWGLNTPPHPRPTPELYDPSTGTFAAP